MTSYRSAMGKSLYIQRLAENLKKTSDISYAPLLTTVPLHGPNVTCDTLLRFLKDHMKHPSCCIYHIDIASSVIIIVFNEGFILLFYYFLFLHT